MNTAQNLKAAVGYLWRVALCAVAYVAGAMAGGAAVSALGLLLPQLPKQADAGTMGLLLLIAGLALAAGLAPLALTALLVRRDETTDDELFARYMLCMA
jgi:hypothetical protein